MNNNMSLANMLVAKIDGISGGNYICTYFESLVHVVGNPQRKLFPWQTYMVGK